jgi:hypothetical protein
MLKTADGDEDNESFMINSAKRRESDEKYGDYDEGEKDTPNTSLDSYSDARTDEKGSQTMLRPLFRSLEEDDKSDPVFTDKATTALSGSSNRSKENYVAVEEERDDESVPSVEEMALPFQLGGQEGRVGTATRTKIMSRTRTRTIMESQELRTSITAKTTIVTMTTIKVEATAATLMMTIRKMTTTGKKAA